MSHRVIVMVYRLWKDWRAIVADSDAGVCASYFAGPIVHWCVQRWSHSTLGGC